MRCGTMKRILAAGLCMAMLSGEILPSTAATVSGGDAITEADENINTEEDTVLTTAVSGVTITLTAPAGALPEGTELVAVEIQDDEQVKTVEQALEAEIEEKDVQIQQYKAFDITLMKDGEPIQPAAAVNVTFEGDIVKAGNENENTEVTIYHVNEDEAVANNMNADVVAEDAVEMETNHFSVYVIVVEDTAVDAQYSVTVEHHLSGSNTPFYKTRTYTINKNQKMTPPVQGGVDYSLVQVIVKNQNGERIAEFTPNDQDVQITITQDITVEMVYIPTVENEFQDDVTFFDYSILGDVIGEQCLRTQIFYGVKLEWCVYDGKEYNDIVYRPERRSFVYSERGDELAFTLSEGSVLTDVRVQLGETHIETSRMEVVGFDEYGRANVKYPNPTSTTTYDAGINKYGIGNETTFLSMGQSAYSSAELMITKNINGTDVKLNANENNATNGNNPEKAIIPNLITGLTPDLKDVVTADGVYEPGYFNSDPLEGKSIYSERFKLIFERDGHKYVLKGSLDKETGKLTAAGVDVNNFFPLDDVDYNDTLEAVQDAQGSTAALTVHNPNGSNCFFGMRYDMRFKLGDYEGPLSYTFDGDDDMWVFVDGVRVLDLGGLHCTYPYAYKEAAKDYEPATVDLWQVEYNGKKLIDPEDTEKEHQVTVLYMERGGYDSACHMEFVLPNATPVQSVVIDMPTANLEFTKKSSVDEAVIGGVEFTLTSSDGKGYSYTAVSGADGKVKFENLRVGSYVLKETKYDEQNYVANNKEYKVEVRLNGNNTAATAKLFDDNKEINVIYNTPIQKADIRLKKVSRYDWHSPLAGAEFELRDLDGKVLQTAVSADKTGEFTFTGLEKGIYNLYETKAPIGYYAPKGYYQITVDPANGKQPITKIERMGDVLGMFDMNQGDNPWLIKNEKAVEISVQKQWKNEMGIAIAPDENVSLKVDVRRRAVDSEGNIINITENMTEPIKGLLNRESFGWKAEAVLNGKNSWQCELNNIYESDGVNHSNANGFDHFVYFVKEQMPDTIKEEYEVSYSVAGKELKPMTDAGDLNGYVRLDVDEANNNFNVTLEITNTKKSETGNLVITKEIDKLNKANGDAAFTFKIEGNGEVLYRTITFDKTNKLSDSVEIKNLPVGNYTVTELNTLRYELKEVTVNGNQTTYAGNSVSVEVNTNGTTVKFKNELTNDKNYSHSDVVVNSFRKDGNGVKITQQHSVIEKTN